MTECKDETLLTHVLKLGCPESPDHLFHCITHLSLSPSVQVVQWSDECPQCPEPQSEVGSGNRWEALPDHF